MPRSLPGTPPLLRAFPIAVARAFDAAISDARCLARLAAPVPPDGARLPRAAGSLPARRRVVACRSGAPHSWRWHSSAESGYRPSGGTANRPCLICERCCRRTIARVSRLDRLPCLPLDSSRAPSVRAAAGLGHRLVAADIASERRPLLACLRCGGYAITLPRLLTLPCRPRAPSAQPFRSRLSSGWHPRLPVRIGPMRVVFVLAADGAAPPRSLPLSPSAPALPAGFDDAELSPDRSESES